MRFIRNLLFILILVAGIIAGYKYELDYRKEQTRQEDYDQDNKMEIEKMKEKVDDEAIIKKALKEVGILTVLEGIEEYKQTIEEENWYSYRGINFDWHYRFGIALNLEDLEVQVVDGNVGISADAQKFYIQFIEKTRESSSHSEASIFARKFTSQEISALEKVVLEKVENRIKTTPSYWERAQKSLEANLTKMCNQLGYYRVNIRYNLRTQ